MDAIEEVVTPVNRPFGVSASAGVAIIGSLFAMAVGLMLATIPATPPPGAVNNPPISDSTFHAFAIGMSIFLISFGALGIWTAVGLFSLKAWARTTIMIFAGIMTAICAVSIIAIALVPFPVPKGQSVENMRFMKPVLLAFYALPTLIGAWWLVQFNRPATKAAFASNSSVAESERPLSVSIIAWMFLIAAPGCLITIFAKMPLLVAGIVFTGWAAQIGYLGYAGLSLYLGRGLLKLDELTRKLAIAYFAVTGLHMILVSAIPSWRQKMTALQHTVSPSDYGAGSMGFGQMLTFSLIFALLYSGGGAWFLVRNKKAFSRM